MKGMAAANATDAIPRSRKTRLRLKTRSPSPRLNAALRLTPPRNAAKAASLASKRHAEKDATLGKAKNPDPLAGPGHSFSVSCRTAGLLVAAGTETGDHRIGRGETRGGGGARLMDHDLPAKSRSIP